MNTFQEKTFREKKKRKTTFVFLIPKENTELSYLAGTIHFLNKIETFQIVFSIKYLSNILASPSLETN